jgi:hypothetical protein
MSWENFQKAKYSHEFIQPYAKTKNNTICKLFIDIDCKAEKFENIKCMTEDEFNKKVKGITNSLDNGSVYENFVYTNGSYYADENSKISFHIIYGDKYIDIKDFDVFNDEVVSLVRKSFKGLDTETINMLVHKEKKSLDNGLYNNIFLRLPYGTQERKIGIHIPQVDTQVEQYFVSYVKDGENRRCMGRKEQKFK